MRPEPYTLVSGDQSFIIRPLTLKQVREITRILMRPQYDGNAPVVVPNEPLPSDYRLPDYMEIDRSTDIIMTALGRDYPTIKSEDIEIGVQDIPVICKAILILGGMAVTEVKNPQEVPSTGT